MKNKCKLESSSKNTAAVNSSVMGLCFTLLNECILHLLSQKWYFKKKAQTHRARRALQDHLARPPYSEVATGTATRGRDFL